MEIKVVGNKEISVDRVVVCSKEKLTFTEFKLDQPTFITIDKEGCIMQVIQFDDFETAWDDLNRANDEVFYRLDGTLVLETEKIKSFTEK